MRMHAGLLLLALTASSASAQTNRDDLTPLEVSYTTSVSEDMKSFHVRMEVEHVNRPTLHVAMPAWTPGAYRIGDYGDGVRDFSVLGSSDVELDVTRMDAGTWSIDTRGESSLQLSYRIPVSRRGRRRAADDTTVTGLRLSGPSTYLYVRGAKGMPVRSRYELPDGWKIANGLLPTEDPNVRYARDYDTFIDAPTTLGQFEERTFEVNGTPFQCVFFENAQEYDFDIDAFVAVVEKIVTNFGELFGSYPFPNYVFLFSLPGGGGLEHLNSTTIGLQANRQKEDPEAGASVTSHEFFHTWNVKRIRPKSLGPFDYQRENYTGNLWVAEGWTSYFGELTLARTGILDPDEYLTHLQRIVSREMNKPRRKEHSVFWASRNAWHRFRNEEGSRVDFYATGELLGAMIDLKIRHETGDRKSLNDVMRFMNRWFAESNLGFEELDVERACTAVSNHDFSEFFARHVYGTLDPPLAEYFGYAGIDYATDVIPSSFPFRVRRNRIFIPRGSESAEGEGPASRDVIKTVDGEELGEPDDFLRKHGPGDVVKLVVERDEEELEFEITLVDEPTLIPTLSYREDATEAQIRLRERWLTSVK